MPAAVLPEIDAIDRDQLSDSGGRAFKDVRRGLTPRWTRVWRDIALGYLALVVTALAIARIEGAFPALWPLWGLLGAVPFGFAIAYLQLFIHEAGHFNIAPGRRLNDALANTFIGLMVGQDVRAYRMVHFDHHRLLGTTQDPERSYFDALSVRLVVETLWGIKLLRMLLRQRHRAGGGAPPEATATAVAAEAPERAARRRRVVVLAGSAGLNLILVGAALLAGHWAVALAWVVGMGSVHPFLAATRQVLEHRDFAARAAVDYAHADHGAVTRLFGAGALAQIVGGAGFNRHLLHHWEPQVSYTRLRELEDFLLDTPSAPVVRDQTTSYGRAFARLLRAR